MNVDIKLSWDDLLIQCIDPDTTKKCLGYWASVMPQKPYRVVFLNRLGEWFLQTDDSIYHKLSPLNGAINIIAQNDASFAAMVNSEDWQIENLWSKFVLERKKSGIIVSENQVYAPMPHPALADGTISTNVMPMDLPVWQWVSAQALGFV